MESLFAKYLTIALASTLKFFGGPITGAAMKVGWIETALCSTVGMMFTIILLSTLTEQANRLFDRFRKQPRKLFTRLNRAAVKVWLKFGIIGIAFLTPVLFTPPLGAILIVAFKVPRLKAYSWMLISALAWGFLVSYVASNITLPW